MVDEQIVDVTCNLKTKPVYQLVYSSIALKSISDTQVARLLTDSYEFNRQHNITGCLVYHGHEFLHLLEGERDEVLNLYARISKDKRHKHVTFIFDGEVKERVFDLPYMAGDKLTTIDAPEIKSLISSEDLIELEVSLHKSSLAVKFFWVLVKQLFDTPLMRTP